MEESQLTPRRAGRVVMLDHADRVLLLALQRDPEDAVSWITPGGAAEPGESFAEAACREVREELGLVVRPEDLSDPIATQSGVFVTRSARYAADDLFFLVRTEAFIPDMTGRTEEEQTLITGHRWWTADALAATEDRILPPDLAWLVVQVLREGVPDRPHRLKW